MLNSRPGVGSCRETVERTLRGWRGRGIVSTAYRTIVVHGLESLAPIAGVQSPPEDLELAGHACLQDARTSRPDPGPWPGCQHRGLVTGPGHIAPRSNRLSQAPPAPAPHSPAPAHGVSRWHRARVTAPLHRSRRCPCGDALRA